MKSSDTLAKRYINLLRRNLWLREIQEIHVEAAYSDEVFSRLVSYVKAHQKVFLSLGDPNEIFFKRRIQAENIDPNIYTDILRRRYTEMGKLTNNIGVHVHLFFRRASINIPTYNEQLLKIKQTKEFLSNLGLPTDDFAPGWGAYNTDTIKACEALNFKRFHIFQVWRGTEKSEILQFPFRWNISHDYEL